MHECTKIISNMSDFCMQVCAYMYRHEPLFVCARVYVYIHIYMYVWVRVYMYTHIHIYVYANNFRVLANRNMYIYTHANTFKCYDQSSCHCRSKMIFVIHVDSGWICATLFHMCEFVITYRARDKLLSSWKLIEWLSTHANMWMRICDTLSCGRHASFMCDVFTCVTTCLVHPFILSFTHTLSICLSICLSVFFPSLSLSLPLCCIQMCSNMHRPHMWLDSIVCVTTINKNTIFIRVYLIVFRSCIHQIESKRDTIWRRRARQWIERKCEVIWWI